MSSPFVRRNEEVIRLQTYKYQKDIVTYFDKPVVVYPDEKNKDVFFVDMVNTVLDRKNRRDYMNSFAGDVGVLNIVRKLALQGENAMDGRFAVKEDSFTDLTQLPKSKEEYDRLMSIKNKIWASLDPELKGSMTFEEFCSSWDDSKLDAYISSKTKSNDNKSTDITEPIIEETNPKEGE